MRYYNRMQARFTSANFLLAPLHFHFALRAAILYPGVRRKNVATFTKTHRAFRARPRHRRRDGLGLSAERIRLDTDL